MSAARRVEAVVWSGYRKLHDFGFDDVAATSWRFASYGLTGVDLVAGGPIDAPDCIAAGSVVWLAGLSATEAEGVQYGVGSVVLRGGFEG